MKKIIFLLFTVICCGYVFPQDVFQFPLKDEARFKEVCALISEHRIVKGKFEQTKIISRLKRSLVSKGDFIIAAGSGMVWDTKSPFPSIMAVRRDSIVQSTPSGANVKLDAAGNETFMRFSAVISAVFEGNSQGLLDNFDIFWREQSGSWMMGLIPKEASIRTFASKIQLQGDSAIKSIYLFEQTGDAIQYVLSNHSFPEKLSNNELQLLAP
jgi:hypothetical protein